VLARLISVKSENAGFILHPSHEFVADASLGVPQYLHNSIGGQFYKSFYTIIATN
jgi:hypothetical protein